MEERVRGTEGKEGGMGRRKDERGREINSEEWEVEGGREAMGDGGAFGKRNSTLQYCGTTRRTK